MFNVLNWQKQNIKQSKNIRAIHKIKSHVQLTKDSKQDFKILDIFGHPQNPQIASLVISTTAIALISTYRK